LFRPFRLQPRIQDPIIYSPPLSAIKFQAGWSKPRELVLPVTLMEEVEVPRGSREDSMAGDRFIYTSTTFTTFSQKISK